MVNIKSINRGQAVLASTGAVLFSWSLSAQEAGGPAPRPAELVREEPARIFEAAFEYDFNSAYVWYNAVQNDQMVMQPCVWADIAYFEPFWLGASVWQNYNLTDRLAAVYRDGLSENDYGVFGGATLWSTEDATYAVWTEVTHDWFTFSGVRDGCECYTPDTRDLRAQVRFDNPFLDVYGTVVWMYREFGLAQRGFLYETGLNKKVGIVSDLSAGADWNVNFGDQACLSNLYGAGDTGIGGTTVKLYLVWQVTEWMSLGCTVAYTGVLNGNARQALADTEGYWGDGSGDSYPRDLLWGGINLKVKY